MISIIAQERLLGAALGAILTGVVVFEQRRSIYSLISQSQPQIHNPPQSLSKSACTSICTLGRGTVFNCLKLTSACELREPAPRKNYQSDFAHLWNKAVDKTLGPVIASLSSRGW